jgi:uncharacterized protein YqjF (DUF2071 family)
MQAKTILRPQEHRGFPPPRGPWVMRQTWEELLFAHWPLPADALRPLVPSALALDTYDGSAWLGIVPFRMRDVRPRLVPSVPWLSAFAELNVRTYVTAGDKPGVYFFSLDAGNPLAVQLARRLFHLPYFNARFQITRHASSSSRPWDTISYSCQRTDRRSPLAGSAPAQFVARYRPTGPVFRSQPGSLEAFLTERYCLYSVSPRGTLYRGEIHHRRWPLQPAKAELVHNTLPQADGLPPLPDTAPLLHYAGCLEVLIWPISKVED